MDAGDRGNPGLYFVKRGFDGWVLVFPCLHPDDSCDHGQAVCDAMIDFVEQDLGAVARLPHVFQGMIAFAFETYFLDGLIYRVCKKLQKFFADRF